MKFAYILAPGVGETNVLLAQVAHELQSDGVRLCGTVQIDSDRIKDHRCDMDVRVLPDGPLIRISQSLGPEARGCRLDPSALEQAVALTGQSLQAGAGLMIINKFGKHEAEGRGFRDMIGEAIAREVPVLVGANKMNLDALKAFAGQELIELEPTREAVLKWVKTQIKLLEEA